MFNTWVFEEMNGRFYATRATWDMGGMRAGSAQELADQITTYYTRPE